MTQITPLHTYGIFALKIHGGTIKKIKDIGTVIDLKAGFMVGARPERKFELEHLRLLRSAIKALGVKLEVTPMIDGTPLEPVMIGVDIRGNITIGEEGDVQVTIRSGMDDLEEHGLSVELLMKARNCLECMADEQQTLEESIQSELQSNRAEDGQLEGQGNLFTSDDVRTENAGEAPAPWEYTLILEVLKQGERPGTSVTETREYHRHAKAHPEAPNDPTVHMVRQSPGFGGVMHESTTTWQAAEFDAEARTAVFRQSLRASDRLVEDLSTYGWELKA